MSSKSYTQTHHSATDSVTNRSKRKDLPAWERFLARAWELQRQGKEFNHWRRAAFVLWQIETHQDVGHHRRKARRDA